MLLVSAGPRLYCWCSGQQVVCPLVSHAQATGSAGLPWSPPALEPPGACASSPAWSLSLLMLPPAGSSAQGLQPLPALSPPCWLLGAGPPASACPLSFLPAPRGRASSLCLPSLLATPLVQRGWLLGFVLSFFRWCLWHHCRKCSSVSCLCPLLQSVFQSCWDVCLSENSASCCRESCFEGLQCLV